MMTHDRRSWPGPGGEAAKMDQELLHFIYTVSVLYLMVQWKRRYWHKLEGSRNAG